MISCNFLTFTLKVILTSTLELCGAFPAATHSKFITFFGISSTTVSTEQI